MEKVYDLGNQLIDYFSSPSITTNNNFNIKQPFPYSYETQTFQYGITGPFQLASGTVYATRINRLVTLSFNGVSTTGNNNSSVINFPVSSFPPINGLNSFPVDVIQAGITTPGRLYINILFLFFILLFKYKYITFVFLYKSYQFTLFKCFLKNDICII